MKRRILKLAGQHNRAHEPESVRSELLCAARHVFAAKGFEGASVKDLAKETGHNAALINYYFGGKEGLYRECVTPLFGVGLGNASAILRPARCREDFVTRFELFVENFMTTHLAEQDICIILHRDLHTDVVKQLFKDHLVCFDDTVFRFLKAARQHRIIRSDIDLDLLAKVIVSSLFHLITGDRVREDLGEPTFLSEKRRAATIKQMTCLLLDSFLSREPEDTAPAPGKRPKSSLPALAARRKLSPRPRA